MRHELLEILNCPNCRSDLDLQTETMVGEHVESGQLICTQCRAVYAIVRGVPRFVPVENYAINFGFQWNRFRRTQLDSHSGLPISRDRFFRHSGWSPAILQGKRVLDVGCGAGRFAEVALAAGASVVALDYSSAVDACRQNLGANSKLDLVQGDVFSLPFKPGHFDFVYCFGVLQHTPDVHGAFLKLVDQIPSGGRLAVDVYRRQFTNIFWSKYWLRPLTTRLPQSQLFTLVQRIVPLLLPLSRLLGRVPGVGRKLRYLLPIADYEGVYQLSPSQLREWAVLDTFDMLAPAYDQPQTAETLRAWFEEARLVHVEVFRSGHVVGRGAKAVG